MNLRLQYAQTQKIYDDVASSEIDLGLVAYPRPQRNVDVIQFTEDKMVLICHPSQSPGTGEAVAPKDLSEQPMILFTPEAPTRRAIDRFFRRHGVRPNVVMELDHIATIKHAVEVDIGLSIVPAQSVTNEEAWGTLRVLPFTGDPFTRPTGILYKRGRSFSLADQNLIEVLTEGRKAEE